MKVFVAVCAVMTVAAAIDVPVSRHCGKLHPWAGLQENYYENVAHAVHSMNVPGLQRFNPRASVKNTVPTVNLNVSAPNKVPPCRQQRIDPQFLCFACTILGVVAILLYIDIFCWQVLPFAPDYPLLTDYKTFSMQLVDTLMSHVGVSDDGLGPAWSPVERIAHAFHMIDLWEKILPEFESVRKFHPTSQEVCDCLLDVEANGVKVRASHSKKTSPQKMSNRKTRTPKIWAARALQGILGRSH